MLARASFAKWWQPLPLWLKVLVVAVALPAWSVGVLCALTGRAESPAAYAALAVFGMCAVVGAIFESRNRKSGRYESKGLDLSDGGE